MLLICRCQSESFGESDKLKSEQFSCQSNSIIAPQDVKQWLSELESEAWAKMEENFNAIADLELEANEIEQHCNPGKQSTYCLHKKEHLKAQVFNMGSMDPEVIREERRVMWVPQISKRLRNIVLKQTLNLCQTYLTFSYILRIDIYNFK